MSGFIPPHLPTPQKKSLISQMSAPQNQAFIFGEYAIVCIDSIQCIYGDIATLEIEVQYNDDHTKKVKCANKDTFAAAMKYLGEAINNKRHATDHKWADWVFREDHPEGDDGKSDDDDDDDDDEVVRVGAGAGAEEKNPFPQFIRPSQSIAARMATGVWQIVQVDTISYGGGSTPVVNVTSPDTGSIVQLLYNDPQKFKEIRPDRLSARSIQTCGSWLNKPVLFLPENHKYVLHRGHVRGATMSGDDDLILIQPDDQVDCIALPIKRVYCLMW